MAIMNREYAFDINRYKKPVTLEDESAIGARLMTLIMMEPGDDPLHPDMGVGIRTFRYTQGTLSQLKERIESQIETYLPFYQGVQITIILTPDKVCNIEIVLGGVTYIYDSKSSTKPITIQDVTSS
jgi:hypothetical protein